MLRPRLRLEHKELDLGGPEVILGRAAECTITIDDPLVSRRHARIRLTADGRAWIADLGSRNGVRVNGARVTDEVQLRHGDRIRLGARDVVFDSTDAEPPPRTRVRMTGSVGYCPRCGSRTTRDVRECPHCRRPQRT